MAVTRLDDAPPFDAGAHSKALDANVKKADGSSYQVFLPSGPPSLPPFVQWLKRNVRDKTNELVANVNSLTGRQQNQGVEIDDLQQRVAALEAQPPSGITFP